MLNILLQFFVFWEQRTLGKERAHPRFLASPPSSYTFPLSLVRHDIFPSTGSDLTVGGSWRLPSLKHRALSVPSSSV